MTALYKNTRFWCPKPEECTALRDHLFLELPWGHPLDLYRDGLTIEARAKEGDDVIVRTGDDAQPLALVKMTFRGRPEIAPFLPETEFYASEEALQDALRNERVT